MDAGTQRMLVALVAKSLADDHRDPQVSDGLAKRADAVRPGDGFGMLVALAARAVHPAALEFAIGEAEAGDDDLYVSLSGAMRERADELIQDIASRHGFRASASEDDIGEGEAAVHIDERGRLIRAPHAE